MTIQEAAVVSEALEKTGRRRFRGLGGGGFGDLVL